MSEPKTDNEMVDVVTIRYRCPVCSSQQEVNFEVPTENAEIKFHCSDCKFENAIQIKLGNR